MSIYRFKLWHTVANCPSKIVRKECVQVKIDAPAKSWNFRHVWIRYEDIIKIVQLLMISTYSSNSLNVNNALLSLSLKTPCSNLCSAVVDVVIFSPLNECSQPIGFLSMGGFPLLSADRANFTRTGVDEVSFTESRNWITRISCHWCSHKLLYQFAAIQFFLWLVFRVSLFLFKSG